MAACHVPPAEQSHAPQRVPFPGTPGQYQGVQALFREALAQSQDQAAPRHLYIEGQAQAPYPTAAPPADLRQARSTEAQAPTARHHTEAAEHLPTIGAQVHRHTTEVPEQPPTTEAVPHLPITEVPHTQAAAGAEDSRAADIPAAVPAEEAAVAPAIRQVAVDIEDRHSLGTLKGCPLYMERL